jgi:hypothetical protein
MVRKVPIEPVTPERIAENIARLTASYNNLPKGAQHRRALTKAIARLQALLQDRNT